jgi:archaellum biogenesis ATPase FlaH
MTKSITPINSLDSQIKDKQIEGILQNYSKYRISASDQIKPPTPVISISGSSISTEGNVTVLCGDAKSGKSALCNVILAGAINTPGNKLDGFNGFDVLENASGKAVLHFDTEQAKHQHAKTLLNGVLSRVGLTTEPPFLMTYNIRELDIKDYQSICERIFYAANHKFKGIHLAVIDGIADFIGSVNDETESNKIIHFFEKLAIRYKTPIIVVVHNNPNSEKQRGHLGSQLQRKAESLLAIKRSGNVSHIDPRFLRGASITDIPMIQFEYDATKGYHVSCGIHVKIELEDKHLEELEELAAKVFTSTPIKYKMAAAELMNLTKLKLRSVKTKIKEMLEMELIEKNTDGLYVLLQDSPEFDNDDLPESE